MHGRRPTRGRHDVNFERQGNRSRQRGRFRGQAPRGVRNAQQGTDGIHGQRRPIRLERQQTGERAQEVDGAAVGQRGQHGRAACVLPSATTVVRVWPLTSSLLKVAQQRNFAQQADNRRARLQRLAEDVLRAVKDAPVVAAIGRQRRARRPRPAPVRTSGARVAPRSAHSRPDAQEPRPRSRPARLARPFDTR